MPTTIDLYINLANGGITLVTPSDGEIVLTFTPTSEMLTVQFLEKLIAMKYAASGFPGYAKVVVPVA